MDTHAEDSAKAGVDRRRRFTVAYKRRMVEESLAEGASVSVVARRHDVNANQLFKWRKLYREGLLEEAGTASAALVPIHVRGTSAAPRRSAREHQPDGEVEITLSGGHRVVVRGAADRDVLRLALEVLGR